MKFDRNFYKNISFWVYLILASFAASSLMGLVNPGCRFYTCTFAHAH